MTFHLKVILFVSCAKHGACPYLRKKTANRVTLTQIKWYFEVLSVTACFFRFIKLGRAPVSQPRDGGMV